MTDDRTYYMRDGHFSAAIQAIGRIGGNSDQEQARALTSIAHSLIAITAHLIDTEATPLDRKG